EVVEIGKQGLSSITYNGEVLWEYGASAQESEYNIPQWVKNNAKWWAEGQISDKDYVNGLQYLIDQGILRI
ncbi:MAG: phosphate ABC transporter substrate-binding protein PstS, partial [Nitrosopumilaceae archaeon]|nr:phosphate ABC transporter substrate-binding protein PstS [Nitrosopumilaceae archaeon]NIU86085.1 phosphate ABC transporter substrate-binding protein PstS [Nitrosopumilaceae archaeon]NIV64832.1 phosphate ABC transporter substrate-binding protein PstS [Nitrosopumilaceae archaeon]NIX60298.1 phosphate ABC transporter substrate-binding protein PstS [Nitrosopumilaceae archaeon]